MDDSCQVAATGLTKLVRCFLRRISAGPASLLVPAAILLLYVGYAVSFCLGVTKAGSPHEKPRWEICTSKNTKNPSTSAFWTAMHSVSWQVQKRRSKEKLQTGWSPDLSTLGMKHPSAHYQLVGTLPLQISSPYRLPKPLGEFGAFPVYFAQCITGTLSGCWSTARYHFMNSPGWRFWAMRWLVCGTQVVFCQCLLKNHWRSQTTWVFNEVGTFDFLPLPLPQPLSSRCSDQLLSGC